MVSLPSLRDIFPQYLPQKADGSSSSSAEIPSAASPQDVHRDHRMNRPHAPATKPLFITKPIQPLLAHPLTPNWPLKPQSRTSSDGSPVVSQPPSNSINTRSQYPPYPVPPENGPESVNTATPGTPTYSFGVFKSTADGSSLDHIASTTTLRRGRSAARPGFPADGVTPEFSVASASKSPAKQRPGGLKSQEEISAEGRSNISHRVQSASYSSFQLSNPPNNSNHAPQGKIVIKDQDSGTSEDHGKTGEKGKVHECPHCSKRFNRPSSLQIHANTHTGARPFRCPHPNCGREFNVNSNMRRHYRNHARTNVSRSNTTNSKPIRRRAEQIISVDTLALVGATPRDTVATPGSDYIGVLSFPLNPLQIRGDDTDSRDNADDRMSTESDWDRDLDDSEEAGRSGRQPEGDISESESSTASTSPMQEDDESFRPRKNGLGHRHRSGSTKRCSPTATYPHAYTPSSAVYLHSLTDLNVSTVLRPAFNSRTPKEGLVW